MKQHFPRNVAPGPPATAAAPSAVADSAPAEGTSVFENPLGRFHRCRWPMISGTALRKGSGMAIDVVTATTLTAADFVL
jgi:hypothetical protein